MFIQAKALPVVTPVDPVAEHPPEDTVTLYVSLTVIPLALVGLAVVLVNVPEAGLSDHK